MDISKIRNFSIIAHIDHGKSTLADRLLEFTNTVDKRAMKEQILDNMDLEKERGITIKLNSVQMKYKDYTLHLIDTPGHVDFTYEVSRSLAACDGAILVVDAAQGIQAQTIANTYLAIENNLEIIPVINKIDLPAAEPERVKTEIENVLGIDCSNAPMISAKTGRNIEQVLEAIIKFIPAPTKPLNDKIQGLIFDCYFDSYRGVVISVAIKSGIIKKGDKLKLASTGYEIEITQVGVKKPLEVEVDNLSPGQVGWISGNIKDIKKINVGDTIVSIKDSAPPLPGYRKLKPMVYCGMYPVDGSNYEDLGDAIEKISLSDSSLEYEKETSLALGYGYRVGFLGLLHLEIIQERIEREFKIDLISTTPSVKFHVYLTNKKMEIVENPSKMPKREVIDYIEEPYVLLSVTTPNEYIGQIMELCYKKRAKDQGSETIDSKHQILKFHMPLSEIIFDFFDKLKSISKGFASFDYDVVGYHVSPLVKMDILVNHDIVDALSIIVDKSSAYYKGRALVAKLKEVIPKQNFEIPIQASIGNKVIARETIKAFRKDVTGYLYGGDVTRKKKLLEKQKKGKKRMKEIGSVSVPQDAFMAILNISSKDK